MGGWAVLATTVAIASLLLWAGRLMLNAQTADDIAAELPSENELRGPRGPSYGFQVQQVGEDEPGTSPAPSDRRCDELPK